MEQLYMLSGLGVPAETTKPLADFLYAAGFQLVYIDLPGQFSHRDVSIQSDQDLRNWLINIIPQDALIMGYSLGADFLVQYYQFLHPQAMIILDGGILGPDFMPITLEEEQVFTRQYIEESELNMNADTICQLLAIRYHDYKDVFSLRKPALVLLADSPVPVLEYKQMKIEQSRISVHQQLDIDFIAGKSHDFYTEKPEEIAQKIIDYLSHNTKR